MRALLTVLLALFALSYAIDPIVEISDGKLKGSIRKDLDGNSFYSFCSIPFAQPPLGEDRFKDPKPPQKWEGIKDALDDLPICFQKKWDGAFEGSEDCLYLNVHTPEVSPKTLKPVMFFIHGGGFTEGTGRQDFYGPEFLMIEDVVLVTINYRLGVLGFMNFDNPEIDVPGNAALKDQLMALKWVKKNIHHFGGDSKRVTIFGESAGGGSVHLHVLSPLSQGYFQGAIAMSGVATGIWCNGMQNSGPLTAKQLGYEGNDEHQMLKFLQEASFDQLKVALENSAILIPLHISNVFGPTIEKQSKSAFLPDTPRNLIKKGNFQKVPFMIGYTDQDGMVVDVLHFVKYGKYDPLPISKFVPYFLDLSSKKKEKFESKINNFYFPNGHNVQDMIDLETDAYFTWSIYECLFGHLKHQQDLFFYIFTSDTKQNRFKAIHPVTLTYKGACHMDELGYLLPNSDLVDVKKDSIEDKSIRVTTKLFANFAKYGQPTRTNFDVEWKKTNAKKFNYVEIKNDKIQIGHAPNKKRAVFWCDLFKKYNPDMEQFCDWSQVKTEL